MAGIDQKTLWDFARIVLKGVSDKQQAQSVRAKFLRTDPDGTQWVQLDGSSEETPVNGRTLASAQAGDTVELEISDGVLSLDGNASEPSVGMRSAKKVANEAAEGARRMAADAGMAAELSKQIADAARQVAEAINQHFWHDTNGIHVTEAAQEDWNDNHSGANVLINSIGQLFRDGLNNLLTLTTENGARALTIWDGLGNAAGNVVARFGTTIRLGSDEYPMLDISDGTIYFYPTADDVQSLYFGSTTRIQRLLNGSLKLQSDNGEVSLYGQTIGVTPANGSNTFSTAPGTVLWSSGGWYMSGTQTANLKYNVSTCPTGIVLHFQPYTSSTTKNYNHTYYFVPKEHVASYSGTSVVVQLGNPDFSNMASKYLYISNDHITGHANNTATGTGSGITYNNGTWVMTQVIAV